MALLRLLRYKTMSFSHMLRRLLFGGGWGPLCASQQETVSGPKEIGKVATKGKASDQFRCGTIA